MSNISEDLEQYCIEEFQLENLINNNISFLCFNLSAYFVVKSSEDWIISLFKKAVVNTEKEVQNSVKKIQKLQPIVLLCETGEESSNLAQILHKKGYINTFFVKGGMVSLNS